MVDRLIEVVDPADNVATVLRDVEAGETVTKYGKSIGQASTDISPGEWVHVHNVDSNYGRGDLAGDEQAQAVHE